MIKTFILFGQFSILTIMSYRDIRQQVVLDRDLAWFAFLNTLPLILSTMMPMNDHGVWAFMSRAIQSYEFDAHTSITADHPTWFSQLLFLLSSTGGALFLFVVSLFLKLMSSREMIGSGDILFTLVAGLGANTWASLRIVLLAFLLALPASILIKLAKTTQNSKNDIPFIPFLSLAFILVNVFPNATFWLRLFF